MKRTPDFWRKFSNESATITIFSNVQYYQKKSQETENKIAQHIRKRHAKEHTSVNNNTRIIKDDK